MLIPERAILKRSVSTPLYSTAVVAPRIGPLALLARWLRALWSDGTEAVLRRYLG